MTTVPVYYFDQGEVLETTEQFTVTDTGALIDPTAVYFVLQKYDGTFVRGSYLNPGGDQSGTATITKVSTGTYRTIVLIDQGGTWNGRWYATGNGALSQPFQLSVSADALT